MLDEYLEQQKIIYDMLINSIKNNKISHAYLIENSNIKKGLDFALAFSKFLLCPKHNTNLNKCENCTQCEQISNGDFLELEFIRPDGKNIKKEQIIKLQENFRYKPIIGSYKIYIIEHAEMMNEESTNSLLKFLEEPSESIIAILVTTNMYQIFDTIRSRCQILKMIDNVDSSESTIDRIVNYLYDDVELKELFLNNNPNEKIDLIIDYVDFFEKNKLKAIIFKNKNISNMFNDNFDINYFFKFLIIFYKDILNYIISEKVDYFNNYMENIDSISKINTKENISNKLNIIIDLSNKVRYNVNVNLILDKIVISLAEV